MDLPHLPRSAGQMPMEGRTSSPSADARANGCNCVWRTPPVTGWIGFCWLPCKVGPVIPVISRVK